MAITILHAATAVALAAAGSLVSGSQQAQCEALVAPWAGSNVRVRIYSGTTLRRTLTIGPWTINTSASPRRVVSGAGLADAAVSAGVQTRVVFELLDGTPIFECGGSAASSGAEINWQYGQIRTLCTPTLALEFLANAALPATSMPAWITAMASRTWAQIPGNTLSAVDPDPGRTAPWAGDGGQAQVWAAWGSLCVDPATGELYTTGGGHRNYYGNEWYRHQLLQAVPAWSRISEPSVESDYSTAVGTATRYLGGGLRSTHIFNGLIYVPTRGPAMAGLSSRSHDGGNGTMAAIYFNKLTGAATLSTAAANSGSGTPVAACFDATRGAEGSMWIRRTGTSFMLRHDIAADTRVTVGGQKAFAAECSMAPHPSGSYMLIGSEGDGGSGGPDWSGSARFCVFDPATGNYHFPTFTGAVSGGLLAGKCQPVWVPSVAKFCAWHNSTNRERVTTLVPTGDPFVDPWEIDYLSVSGANTVVPTPAAVDGTYGRFRLIEQAGLLVLFNATNQPGYAFKV